MEHAARVRSNPADLINAAIDTLIKTRHELPALGTLRRLAGSAQERVHSGLFKRVHQSLSAEQRKELDTLVMLNDDSGESLFSQLSQPTGPANRKSASKLIQQLMELRRYEGIEIVLKEMSAVKVQQWADEAQRLTATELGAYRPQRRRCLLLCLVHAKRTRLLDQLATLLIMTVRQLEHRARALLDDWLATRHRSTEHLLIVFGDVLRNFQAFQDPATCHAQTTDTLNRAGGVSELLMACDSRLQHRVNGWREFLEQPYRSQRKTLLDIVAALPFRSADEDNTVLSALHWITRLRSTRDTWVALDINSEFLGKKWKSLVLHLDQPGAYHRRNLEIAALFEVVAGLRAGDIYIDGADSFGNYRTQLYAPEDNLQAAAADLGDSGFPTESDALVEQLRSQLNRSSRGLELAICRYRCVELDANGRPIVPRSAPRTTPASVIDLATNIDGRLPQRAIIEALYNTDRWAGWTRHFGPPARVSSQIDNPAMRYVLTTFAYGCGLGPTQASRHIDVPITEDLLRFVNRRHIGVDELRAACTDLIDLYAQFELPACWGSGQAAAADGTLIETYENNLTAAYHVRYQRTGAVAYRHIADNYVALFSQFVVCGVHEAVYILDGIIRNQSTVRPNRLHADSHGQSEAVFGLAYLLGIELMPRIRNWRKLVLYSAASTEGLTYTKHLYGGIIDWDLIARHWDDYLHLRLAISSGRMTPSAILARLNSYSRRNPLYRALQELGRVVRTSYLLGWIHDDDLRATVTQTTNKVESFHAFSAHFNFGNAGITTSNHPTEQEKRTMYNQLVCNAVMLQNVADQTRALHELQGEGMTVSREDLSFFSPYGTRNWKRFGDYRAEYPAEPYPQTHLKTNPEAAS